MRLEPHETELPNAHEGFEGDGRASASRRGGTVSLPRIQNYTQHAATRQRAVGVPFATVAAAKRHDPDKRCATALGQTYDHQSRVT